MSGQPGGSSWRGRGGSVEGEGGEEIGEEGSNGRGAGIGGGGGGTGVVGVGSASSSSSSGSNGAGEAQLAFWEARRAAWLGLAEGTANTNAPHASSPTLTSSAPARPARVQARGLLPRITHATTTVVFPGQPHPHPGRQRLEQLLSVDNAEADEGIWSSIRQVWQRLTAGTQLTTPLPLGMVVRILRGGWIRDGTWPLTIDGPALVAEETGEETGNGSRNGNGHHGGNGGGGNGHGQAAGQAQGTAVEEVVPPAVEEPLEEEGTATTTTEVSEGTVLSMRDVGSGSTSGRPRGEQ